MKTVFSAIKYFAVAVVGVSVALFFEYGSSYAIPFFVLSLALAILAELAKRQIAEAEADDDEM